MSHDITPGTYRNTNTGVEFAVELDDEADEVILHDIHGPTDLEIRKDKGTFWFNTLDATGPTYELIEPADTADTPVETDTDDTATV